MIAKELCTVHGNAPYFIRQLHVHDLNPKAKWIVMRYLDWKMERLSAADITGMLDQISTEDLMFYAGQRD